MQLTSLQSLNLLNDVALDSCAFEHFRASIVFDHGAMQKDVAAHVLRNDKSETFNGIEPLHGALHADRPTFRRVYYRCIH